MSDMRLEVKRKRRTWIRYRVERDRQNLRGYIAEYKKRIKERKREVWEAELDKMNTEDIFGDAYKVLRRRKGEEVVLTTMRKSDGSWTTGVEDTLSYVLNEILPDDEIGEDTVEHARRRREVRDWNGGVEREERSIEVVERELELAVRKFKNKKAPGEERYKG